MLTRQPCAAQFYAGDVRAQMKQFAQGFTPPDEPKVVSAGVVPHAGWFFSGATAARVFLTIKARQAPRTFVLFGTVHVPGVRTNAVYSEGAWDTPLGPVEVDTKLSGELLDSMSDILVDDQRAHLYEHSIEVQTPMIKHLFPDSRIVPIAVPPGEDAVELGMRVGRKLKGTGGEYVVIGSTDLTHYGDNYGFTPAGYGDEAYLWMLKNDEHIVQLALAMKSEEILVEASVNRNACGPGAMAAAVAAAKAMGAQGGTLIERTTSYDVHPDREFTMAVGYAGIVF